VLPGVAIYRQSGDFETCLATKKSWWRLVMKLAISKHLTATGVAFWEFAQ